MSDMNLINNSGDVFRRIQEIDGNADRKNREFDNFFIARRPLLDPLSNTHTYIFFTSPDLPLSEDTFRGLAGSKANVSTIMNKNGRFLKLPGYGDSIYSENIVKMLSGGGGMFMPLFTNRALGIPSSDQTLDVVEYSETWNKYKISMGTTTKDTQIAGNFEIPMMEDQNLTVIRTLKLWVDTIQAMFLGDVISAVSTQDDIAASQNAYNDYSVSAYVFVTRPDAKTLIYWSKYTGLFPTKIPYGVLQTEDGGGNIIDKVSAEFQFSYKEDMDIAILNDFNLTQSANKGSITNFTGKNFFDNYVKLVQSNVNPSIAKVQNDPNGNPLFELRMSETNDPNYPQGYSNF
ncbi:hypothetical protein [Proteus mirabilis]|uniref:hypothetical protein n=1 Tax=Proteus mirabilis TaxID=584 RepID=UPI0034D5EB1F